jgi:hypothetical protein
MLAVSVSEMEWTLAAEMTDNAAPRHSGQWKKGQSGNPAGMPKGTRHRATQLAEKLMEDDAENIVRASYSQNSRREVQEHSQKQRRIERVSVRASIKFGGSIVRGWTVQAIAPRAQVPLPPPIHCQSADVFEDML